MFKYTPNAKLVESYKRALAKPYNTKNGVGAAHRWMTQRFTDYRTIVEMQKHWLNTVYMSETKVKYVPVNGLLVSVEMFDVEKV
jgi:hypothetical protein